MCFSYPFCGWLVWILKDKAGLLDLRLCQLWCCSA
uniref:Uncharacterized protein n=1 Tax=Arundo donax TaxID=35708 RepID=A0A0A9BF93_ARUDO